MKKGGSDQAAQVDRPICVPCLHSLFVLTVNDRIPVNMKKKKTKHFNHELTKKYINKEWRIIIGSNIMNKK